MRPAILALAVLTAFAAACNSEGGASAPALANAIPSEAPNAAVASSAKASDEAVVPVSSSSLVDLDGASRPLPALADGSPRLASIALVTDIYARPDKAAKKIGYLRAGAVVATIPGSFGKAGCDGGWRKIEPAGFVCLGVEATEDLANPIARASTKRPEFGSKLPYAYGTVTRGGPVYARIPTEEDLAAHEPNLAKHMAKWKKDDVSGAAYGLDVWLSIAAASAKKHDLASAWAAWEDKESDPEVPWYLANGGRVPNLSGLVKSAEAVKIDELTRRNGVAFVDSFLSDGRRYNVSTDLRVMPADRFRPIRGSDFHGYAIGKDIHFPFALVRKPDGKRWKWSEAKKKLVSVGDAEWRSAIQLTGKQKFFGGVLHYETDTGDYVDDRHAGRIDAAKKMPGWAKNGEKWIDVNVTKQVLVAYEGEKAVFATLVSTGESGLEDPETTRSTKRGIFRIHAKHVSVTMDSEVVGEEYELRDVPYVQYFEGGYALHGAYWHDAFGRPKSHGCINLAPEDAKRLFFWTEPAVPPAWHGAFRSLTGTVVFVHP